MERSFPTPDRPHVIVLTLKGDIVRHEDSRFEILIDEILDKGQRVFIMDFRDVEFMDSAGIGLIIKIASQVEKRHGVLRLCNPKGNVKNVFAMLGIEERFKLYPTLADALRAYGDHLSLEFVAFKF